MKCCEVTVSNDNAKRLVNPPISLFRLITEPGPYQSEKPEVSAGLKRPEKGPHALETLRIGPGASMRTGGGVTHLQTR